MENDKPNLFYAGLSGIVLPVPRYRFPEPYQDHSRLAYYSTFFNSIEINSTFYKLPLAKTVSNWITQVPDDFRFTFKLWKEITHRKELEFEELHVEQFFRVIRAAENKKGCVLIQFPPSLGSSAISQLELLLQCILKYNAGSEWKMAVEFRNRSWYSGDVYDLLHRYATALVIQDIPKSLTPMVDHRSPHLYIRFHGPTGNYRDSYADDFLSEYAGYMKEWISEGKVVYTYFNNTAGDAFRNLQLLNTYMTV